MTKSLSHEEALAYLGEQSGRHFDPSVVLAFVENRDEVGRIRASLADPGHKAVESTLADEQRTGFVAVDFPDSEAASKQLIAEHYKLDWRPNCGLRLGPHFYNTEAEVHRLMDRIVALAGRA